MANEMDQGETTTRILKIITPAFILEITFSGPYIAVWIAQPSRQENELYRVPSSLFL